MTCDPGELRTGACTAPAILGTALAVSPGMLGRVPYMPSRANSTEFPAPKRPFERASPRPRSGRGASSEREDSGEKRKPDHDPGHVIADQSTVQPVQRVKHGVA